LSFQVIFLLTDTYISSMPIRHYRSLNCYSSSSSKHYANLIPHTVERFFLPETKVLCQEKKNGFDTCNFQHLKKLHWFLVVLPSQHNQLKHTLDSVFVIVLSKVLKFRKSESHVLKEA